MNFVSDFLNLFKGVSVYALVGESGTGKSYRAKLIAQKNGLDAIIDDGLLIKDDKIIAGHSAKKELTYMGAVRVALFDDKAHRDEVAKALQKSNIKKILILGTSDRMVKKIALRLQLPAPVKVFKIEDVASKEEIELARRSRQIEGKHVIPVPAIEVKREYPNIFLKSLNIFFGKREKDKVSPDGKKGFAKSVVRPEFSKKGRVIISEAAICQFVMHSVLEFDNSIKVKKLVIKTTERGYKLIITIDVPFGTQLSGKIHDLQKYIIDNIEKFTGIFIEEVSIIIDKITQTENNQTKNN
jgi:adenylate kinase family enzyme